MYRSFYCIPKCTHMLHCFLCFYFRVEISNVMDFGLVICVCIANVLPVMKQRIKYKICLLVYRTILYNEFSYLKTLLIHHPTSLSIRYLVADFHWLVLILLVIGASCFRCVAPESGIHYQHHFSQPTHCHLLDQVSRHTCLIWLIPFRFLPSWSDWLFWLELALI